MKNIILKYVALLAIVVFTSCNENPDWRDGHGEASGNQGTLNLSCFTTTDLNHKAESGTSYTYAIEVRNTLDEVVFTTPDLSTVTDGIKLATGEYTVYATSGSLETSASRTPCYTGSTDVTIEAGVTTNVTITTALNNVKVTTVVEPALDAFFDSYEVVVLNNNHGVLSFTNDENIGYFSNSGTLTWEFKIHYTDGSTKTVTETIQDTKPQDHYILTFKLGDDTQTDGLETTVEVEDMTHNYQITISGTPPAYSLKLVNGWAKFIEVEGAWTPAIMPAGLCFEYRIDGTDSWITVAPTVDPDNRTVKAKIAGLTPLTKYFVRIATDNEKGTTVECMTEDATEVFNLGFDTWSVKGKNQYPNTTAANSFWATGNEGVTTAGKNSTTSPSDDKVGGDKAAKMESIYVSFLFVKTFAAGNLFTGHFKTVISNPIESAKMGRAYTARPTGLKGWYKYKSTTINHNFAPNKDEYAKYIGTPDFCHIYVQLENWGDLDPDPAKRPMDNAGITVVGYGEFKTDQTNMDSGYEQFSFDINYTNKTLRPTHITIAAASSIYGGFFVGGEGSTLYVDEFELLWD